MLQPEEINTLKEIESTQATNEWPLIVRIQEADQKESQILYLYIKLVKQIDEDGPPQLVVIDQKLEMPNPFEQEGISSFRTTPVFLSSPNSSTPSPCLICLNESANLVSLPCGHLALGDLCIKTYFEKNDNRLCLVCRQEVKELVSISDSGFDFERATEHRKELDNKEENGGIYRSFDQSGNMSTIKNDFKKENSIISESNLQGEKTPRIQTPTGGLKKKHVFSMKNNLQSYREEMGSVDGKKDDVKSFSVLPMGSGLKKDISNKFDMTIKGDQILGNLANISNRNAQLMSKESFVEKDLQSTGIANRKSEPDLKTKNK